MNRRPQLRVHVPAASPEEAAAVVAALEQFMRNHAPVFVEDTGPAVSPWKAAALSEGVHRAPDLPAFWA
ncbi:MAG TPA: hypothetical protein VFN48_10790 [Solirubrobacteraceae bacterium]|nr:hypothetical protein [Solirubrobacteraceae bacterium]